MTLKFAKAPSVVLAFILAVAMCLTMGPVQTAYADEYDNFEVQLNMVSGHDTSLPGEEVQLSADTFNEFDETIPEDSGARFNWSITEGNGYADMEIDEDDPSLATITLAEPSLDERTYMDESDENSVAGEEEIYNNEVQIKVTLTAYGRVQSVDYYFLNVSNDFVRLVPDINDVNQLDVGDTQELVTDALHITPDTPEGEPVADAEFKWDNDGYDDVIAISNKQPKSGEAVTIERLSAEAGAIFLDATYTDKHGEEGDVITASQSYYFDEISSDMADYTIYLKDSPNWQVYLESGDIIDVNDISVRSGNGEKILNPNKYDLTVKKILGYDTKTGEEIAIDVPYPYYMTYDGMGAKDPEGNLTEGTAEYMIIATAKDGSGYTGETAPYDGHFEICDPFALTAPAGLVIMNEAYLSLTDSYPYEQYEVTPGTILKPAVYAAGDRKLLEGSEYSLVYLDRNDTDAEGMTKFPKKPGEYVVKVTGEGEFYGENSTAYLKIGYENSLYVTAKTATVKASKLKKKARTVSALRIGDADGPLEYYIVGGSAKAQKALKINESTGKITVKKKTKKGKYKVQVNVMARGDDSHLSADTNVWVTVRVK